MTEKIVAKGQWDEKFLRESPWMPFGTLGNIVAKAFEGKGITPEQLKVLADKMFELAMKYTKDAYERVEKEQKGQEVKLPTKNENN